MNDHPIISKRTGEAVGSWDGRRVDDLASKITELLAQGNELIDLEFPYQDDFPMDQDIVVPYAIWAIDRGGRCLVGDPPAFEIKRRSEIEADIQEHCNSE